jgi:NAD(P)H-flavin reductase
VAFFVRLVPGGELTEWLFSENRTGARVNVAGPFGNLWLRPSTNPILCVAGGSGLAPIKALLEEANEQDCDRETVVIFGAREERDLYCLEELAALATSWSGPFSFVPVLSQEAAASAWPGTRGLVTGVVEDLPRDFLLACDVYTCGPPVMIDALEAEVAGLGRGPANFHADRFVTRTAGGVSVH